MNKGGIKDFILPAAVLFVGAALTVMSFCLYYLVSPLHMAVLVLLFILDFIYTIVCSCGLLKYGSVKNWHWKGVLMAVLYIPAFILVSSLFLLFCNATNLLTQHIVEIVYCAFFTGPSIIFVIIIALLAIACLGYA